MSSLVWVWTAILRVEFGGRGVTPINSCLKMSLTIWLETESEESSMSNRRIRQLKVLVDKEEITLEECKAPKAAVPMTRTPTKPGKATRTAVKEHLKMALAPTPTPTTRVTARPMSITEERDHLYNYIHTLLIIIIYKSVLFFDYSHN